MTGISSEELSFRRDRLSEALTAAEVDVAFCPPSGDLEYLTGFPRKNASFGNSEYANHWLLGAFLRPGVEPIFLIPEGYAAFNLAQAIDGDVVRVRNADDATMVFADVVRRLGRVRRVAVATRTWARTTLALFDAVVDLSVVDLGQILGPMRRIKSLAELDLMEQSSRVCDLTMTDVTGLLAVGVTEHRIASEVDFLMREHGGRTPSFDTGVFSMGPDADRDASTRLSKGALREGLAVSFDFGTVIEGYCSDFGRTIHIGEPGAEYKRAYETVIEAQAVGARTAVPGATFCDVHRATRAVIEASGYGEWFRHRTGHCIGLDTHEQPFVSEEDRTILEENMTFTIEPSIFWPGRLGVRVEDLFVCRPGGAESLNHFHHDLVAV